MFADVGRALTAGLAGDTGDSHQAFAAALAKAEALGPAGTSMSLSVLAQSGRRQELVRRTHAFLDPGPDVDPGFAATLWLNARCFDQAAAVLDAAGLSDPPPAAPYAGWDELERRARIALGQHRVAAAATYAAEAVRRFETWFATVPGDTFRVALSNNTSVRRCYQSQALAALACDDHEGGFEAVDRIRSLALAGLLAEQRWAHDAGGFEPLLRAWRQAQALWSAAYDRRRQAWRAADPATLASTAAEVHAATAALEQAATLLEQNAPTVVAKRPSPLEPVAAHYVMAALPHDTVVIEYLLGDDELLAWALTDNTCHGWRADVDSLAVSGTASRAHRAMATAATTGLSDDLSTLADILLTPVQSQLDAYARVVFVPFGTLNLLPFHVLPLHGGALGDHHVVSQLPAASLIPLLAGRPAPCLDRGAVVVGDPATNPARGLPRLPGAAIEARLVAQAYGVEPLLGADATEAAVRHALPGSSIAHFATHGLLDDTAPNLSSLVFAGDDDLTVAELLGLDLDLDLAVLSACDTGRGNLTSAGEVIGLARGFLAAGCRHSVVSLWPVDDVAACITMTTFAERIAAGTSIADALADARNETRRLGNDRKTRYLQLANGTHSAPQRSRARDDRALSTVLPPADHPYWWAAFVHIGL